MRTIVTAYLIVLGIFLSHEANDGGNPQAGKRIFDHYCKDCHKTGAKGAPMVGDKAAWAERIKQGELLLTQHAYFGHRKMPVFGDCAECTREDFADAVAYMVSKSK